MKRFFKLLLCLSAVAGCAMEELPTSSEVTGITEITVNLPQTKVAVDETSGKCTWSDGDKVALWDKSAKCFVEFVLVSGSGSSSAKFESATAVSSVEGAEVIYPSAYACVISDKGEAVVDLPNVNALVSDGTVPVVMRGTVSLNDGEPVAGFHHVNGVLKFTLSDVPAYAAGVVLKSDKQNLAGESVDGVISSNYSSKALKVSFPYKTGYSEDVPVFFSLPAGTYSDLHVYLVDGDGDIIEGTQKKIKSATLKSGQYVIMPLWDLNRDQLRKDYVKVCGVNWAKGNLVSDASNAWHTKETGIDDGFQTGWGLHDEQWKYINWDESKNTAAGRYNQSTDLYDHFNWGGIGRLAMYRTGGMIPSKAKFSIVGKIFTGYSANCDPVKLEEVTGDGRFSSEKDSKGNIILNGKQLGGDVAFWASRGKYRLPNASEIKSLAKYETSASYQKGYIVKDGKTIYGYLYTTPLNGVLVQSSTDVEFSDADLESGLFLPLAGRRGPIKADDKQGYANNNTLIINCNSQGVYRSGIFGSLATGSHWNSTVVNLQASKIDYGYTLGSVLDNTASIVNIKNKTDEEILDAFTDNTFSNGSGLLIRPVLVDVEGSKSVPGDVQPLERSAFDAVIGMPLPEWEEGCLDIHAINSGRGECTFFIMPDGTSLCVDAGEIAPEGGTHPRVDPKPNKDVRAYKVYAEYIKKYLPQGQTSLDYMLVTHFHGDHVGTFTGYRDTKHEENQHILTGVTALYEEVPFNKVIDRIYPDYDQITATGEDVTTGTAHYKNFVNYYKDKGLKAEKSAVGSTDQLVMVRSPKSYPEFTVQIKAANGEYWDGCKSVDPYGTAVPAENGNSISFLLSYGDFDYLTSGDAGSNTKIEENLSKSINRKIEAMKAHHHFSWNTMSAAMMKIYQPKVVVSQSFYDHQPDMGHSWVCDNTDFSKNSNQEFQKAWAAYSSEKYWYFTNIHPKTADVYPYEVAKMRSQNGHVVIRVKEGGSEFYVYVLDDTDFGCRVKQIDGPFSCHK